MKHDDTIHEAAGRLLAAMVVILAGLVGLVGLSLADPSLDASRMQPVHSARAAQLPHAPEAATGPAEAHVVTPEENWAADESSHGLRPDAAH